MGRYGIPAQMRGAALLFAVFSMLALTVVLACSPACSAEDIYSDLKQKLEAEGYSHREVSRLFDPPPPTMFKLVASTCKRREGGPPIYDQYLAPARIAAALNFIDAHRDAFKRAQSTLGVEPGIIAAILLIETHFGSYTGKTPALAVFSSFAVMDRKNNRDRVWKMLSARDRARWDRDAFDARLLSRSEWAINELKAILELEKTRGISGGSLRGSYMGAVGWPQFLPSSIVKYGVDGDGDGVIDLYNADDAIFSTANYLRGYGWCEAKYYSDKERVIWGYNHSKPYVRTVLEIADRLK